MSDNDNKPWYTQLPAKLVAVVVFLVALTTLAGNVAELFNQSSRPETIAPMTNEPTPARAPDRNPEAASAPQPTRLRLQVDRIIVHGDGSPGTTDWRFAVDVDDRPLFVFEQASLTDQDGRNVVAPDQAGGIFHPRSGDRVKLQVRGWRGSRLRLSAGGPDVAGEVWVLPRGVLAPLVVQGDRDDAGSFEFHVSISPE